MTLSRDDKISALCEDITPRTQVRFVRAAGEMLGVNAASLLLVSAAYGIRPDISARLAEPLYLAELTLHLALIVTASVTAAALAFPDRAYGLHIIRILYTVVIAYSGFALFTASGWYPAVSEDAHAHAHGIACAGCLLSFAAVPALFGVWRIATLASVRPLLAGFAAFIAAAAVGSLGLRLVESEIVPHGMFTWHIMPFLLLGLAGVITGKKIFRLV